MNNKRQYSKSCYAVSFPLLYRKVLLSENLGTKIARSKAGIVNQTVWIKRCKSPLHQNRHHQGYQIHVRNNPYPEVRRHSCHGLL